MTRPIQLVSGARRRSSGGGGGGGSNPFISKPTWGMCSHLTMGGSWPSGSAQASVIADSGAKIIRDDIPWSWTEGNADNSYSLTFPNGVLGPAQTNGWKVMAQTGFTPGWARNNIGDDKTVPNTALYPKYGEYLRWLLQYAHDNYPGVLQFIDMWNEPNWGFLNAQGGGVLDATSFFNFMRQTYEIVKGINPVASDLTLLDGVKMVCGSMAGNGDFNGGWNGYGWFRPVIAAANAYYGAGTGMRPGRWFDYWATHNYQYNSTSDTANNMLNNYGGWQRVWLADTSGYGTVIQQLDAAGYGPGTLLHATEWGVPSKPYPSGSGNTYQGSSETEQANLFQQGWAQWKAWSRAGMLFWYAAADYNSASTSDDQGHFGAYRDTANGLSAKPVVAQMKAVPSSGIFL